MARLSRVIAPGFPHVVAKEGNRQLRTFSSDEDYLAYQKLLARYSDRYYVRVLGFCLMPDLVKLLVIPETSQGLVRCMAEVNRRYALRVNEREGCRGHLWRNRFSSFVLDHVYLPDAMRYIERWPVRVGLCEKPEDWPWSSAASHVGGTCDGISDADWLWQFEQDSGTGWGSYIGQNNEALTKEFMLREKTGRPIGDEAFLRHLSSLLGRNLIPGKPGRPRKKARKIGKKPSDDL